MTNATCLPPPFTDPTGRHLNRLPFALLPACNVCLHVYSAVSLKPLVLTPNGANLNTIFMPVPSSITSYTTACYLGTYLCPASP